MRTFLLNALVVSAAHCGSLPAFRDFPAANTPPKVDVEVEVIVPRLRKNWNLKRGLEMSKRDGVNFAGAYTVVVSGCGTGCGQFCVIDRMTGVVYPGVVCAGGPEFEFTEDSKLLIAAHTDGMYGDDDPEYLDCYVLGPNGVVFLSRYQTTHRLWAQKHDSVRVVKVAQQSDPNRSSFF